MPSTKPYKAIAAFVLYCLGLILAQVAGFTDFSDASPFQWVVIVIGAFVQTGVVYGVTNPAARPLESPH